MTKFFRICLEMIFAMSKSCHYPLYAYALIGKLLLEFSPHVILIPLGVMKVTRLLGELKAAKFEFLEGEIEERVVVGLKGDEASAADHLLVLLQVQMMGEPSVGVAVLGPGVAEIDVDPVYLIFGKIVIEELSIRI